MENIRFGVSLFWKLALIPIVYRSPYARGYERNILLTALIIWSIEISLSQVFIWLQSEREFHGKQKIRVKNQILDALLHTGAPAKDINHARLLLVAMPILCVVMTWFLYFR